MKRSPAEPREPARRLRSVKMTESFVNSLETALFVPARKMTTLFEESSLKKQVT